MVGRDRTGDHYRFFGYDDVFNEVARPRILRRAAGNMQQSCIFARYGFEIEGRIVQGVGNNTLRADEHQRLNTGHGLAKVR